MKWISVLVAEVVRVRHRRKFGVERETSHFYISICTCYRHSVIGIHLQHSGNKKRLIKGLVIPIERGIIDRYENGS